MSADQNPGLGVAESIIETQTIFIAKIPNNGWNLIVNGNRFADGLGWDEVLGTVAAELLGIPSHARYRMSDHFNMILNLQKAQKEAGL